MPSIPASVLRKPVLRRPVLRKIVPLLFLPAGVGLLFEIAIAPSVPQKILALALAIFCPELTRMAWIDLKNIETITEATTFDKTHVSPVETALPTASDQLKTVKSLPELSIEQSRQAQQLRRFHAVVVSTIVLEATGFYLTFASLPVGATAIMLSQVWFNLLAAVQLHPTQPVPVVPSGVQDRQAVLAINAVTAGLLCLWPIQFMRLGLAIALLTLVTLYLLVKYSFAKAEKTLS